MNTMTDDLKTEKVLEELKENELSDKEFKSEVQEIKKSSSQGNTTTRCVSEIEQEYRGISFTIHLQRYARLSPSININADFLEFGNRQIYISSDDPVAEKVRTFGWPMRTGFLQLDTTHSVHQGMSLEEMLEYALNDVKQDIDWLHDEAPEEVEEHLKEQRQEFQKIMDMIGDNNN